MEMAAVFSPSAAPLTAASLNGINRIADMSITKNKTYPIQQDMSCNFLYSGPIA